METVTSRVLNLRLIKIYVFLNLNFTLNDNARAIGNVGDVVTSAEGKVQKLWENIFEAFQGTEIFLKSYFKLVPNQAQFSHYKTSVTFLIFQVCKSFSLRGTLVGKGTDQSQ